MSQFGKMKPMVVPMPEPMQSGFAKSIIHSVIEKPQEEWMKKQKQAFIDKYWNGRGQTPVESKLEYAENCF